MSDSMPQPESVLEPEASGRAHGRAAHRVRRTVHGEIDLYLPIDDADPVNGNAITHERGRGVDRSPSLVEHHRKVEESPAAACRGREYDRRIGNRVSVEITRRVLRLEEHRDPVGRIPEHAVVQGHLTLLDILAPVCGRSQYSGRKLTGKRRARSPIAGARGASKGTSAHQRRDQPS